MPRSLKERKGANYQYYDTLISLNNAPYQMGELEVDGDDRGRGRCARHRDHRTCCRFCSILTCVTC